MEDIQPAPAPAAGNDGTKYINFRTNLFLQVNDIQCRNCGEIAMEVEPEDVDERMDWSTVNCCVENECMSFWLRNSTGDNLAMVIKTMRPVANEGGISVMPSAVWHLHHNTMSRLERSEAFRSPEGLRELNDFTNYMRAWGFRLHDEMNVLPMQPQLDQALRKLGGECYLDNLITHRKCCQCQGLRVYATRSTLLRHPAEHSVDLPFDTLWHGMPTEPVTWSDMRCELPIGAGMEVCGHTPCEDCYLTNNWNPDRKQVLMTLGDEPKIMGRAARFLDKQAELVADLVARGENEADDMEEWYGRYLTQWGWKGSEEHDYRHIVVEN